MQNVKNHLQKQRTKESKAASGLAPSSAERARRGGRSGSQTASEEDLDDADPMDSEMGAPNRGGAGGGVTSAQAAAAAGPVPPRVGAGAPTLWLPDNWAAPPVRFATIFVRGVGGWVGGASAAWWRVLASVLPACMPPDVAYTASAVSLEPYSRCSPATVPRCCVGQRCWSAAQLAR